MARNNYTNPNAGMGSVGQSNSNGSSNSQNDNAYELPKYNPEYGGRYEGPDFVAYKAKVYFKISSLLIKNFSSIEPYIHDGKGISSLQKTYKEGKLTTGVTDGDSMVVVYQSDADLPVDSKEEQSLFDWLNFADPNTLQLKVVPTIDVDSTNENIGNPPDLVLEIPDKQPFNVNDVIGVMDFNNITIKDNVSQFIELGKNKETISRKKFGELFDLNFSELKPKTFTHLLEEYNVYKKQIPLYKWRADDFFKEYHQNEEIPINYRIQKFFEEFEYIKDIIPKGFLSTYPSLAGDLSSVTDRDLFGWETLTYLVRESQDLIGTNNHIYNQDDARSWLDRITALNNASGSLVIDRDYWKDLYNSMSDGQVFELPETVVGCTDELAANYDPSATEDGGNCIYDDFVDTSSVNIEAVGTGNNNNGPRKLYINGLEIYNDDLGLSTRGLRMTVFSHEILTNFLKTENDITIDDAKWDELYDVYGIEGEEGENAESERNLMAQHILTGEWKFNDVFIVTSYDAIGFNPMLVGALKQIGAIEPIELVPGYGNEAGEPVGDSRTPFVLVGSLGVGTGGGYQSLMDDGTFTPSAKVKINFPLDDSDEGIRQSPGRVDTGTDVVQTAVFEEKFNSWPNIYHPGEYWVRSSTGWAEQKYTLGKVHQTAGPTVEDSGVRLYRSQPKGEWPGALFGSNNNSENTNLMWLDDELEPFRSTKVYLQEGRKYQVEVWGRCNTEDTKAFMFVGDTRGGWESGYSWSKTASWETNNQWKRKTFTFMPLKNKHVLDKWTMKAYYEPGESLGNAPSWDINNLTLAKEQNDVEYIDFDWKYDKIMGVASDHVRVEALGFFYPDQGAGTYTFSVWHDDGAKLWVDGELLVNDWNNGADAWHEGSIYLDGTKLVEVVGRMYENTGHGSFMIYVKGPNDTTSRKFKSATQAQAYTLDSVLPGIYEGVMLNIYLYAGTTNGANPGEYCDYSNLKIIPLETTAQDQEDGQNIVYGCTDAFAMNFNVNATDNDGSCIHDTSTETGCTNAGGNWTAVTTDGEYWVRFAWWRACYGQVYPDRNSCADGSFRWRNTTDAFDGPINECHNVPSTYCWGPHYKDKYASTTYECRDGSGNSMRKGGLIGRKKINKRKLRYGGNVSITNKFTGFKRKRTTPVVTRNARGPIAVSKNIDEYSGNNLLPQKTYGKPRVTQIPATTRISTAKSLSSARMKNFNPKDKTSYQKKNQTNCQHERDFLNSLGGMSLQQMKLALEDYISHHSEGPCLNTKIKRKFNNGGSSRQNCCPTVCGDINGDGSTNVLDIVQLVGAVLGTSSLTEEQQACADITQDGMVNVLDVVRVVNIALGNPDDGCNLCEDDIYGCTDSFACNYNPDATSDDNSCEYPIAGCLCEDYNGGAGYECDDGTIECTPEDCGPELCTGIIGCDGVCYTEWQGTSISNPSDITFLPEFARFDKAGVCGGMTFNCQDVCNMLNENECNPFVQACRQIDIVEQNENSEYYNIIGPLETSNCEWNGFDGICEYSGQGEKGGLIRRMR